MAGTGEINYPRWTKTSTAALQFDSGISRARGRKPWSKITWSSRLGGWRSRPAPYSSTKKKIAKKPTGNTLDRCNLRRHKLCKRTIRLGTLNVQRIRNKTGEIIKGLEESQDITILTETKKKGNGVEILGPYLHFYSGVPKEKRANRGVSILVKKRYKIYYDLGGSKWK